MGTAHAGHDQCAWCYFHYIKPQIAAERQAVKGRRALKRRLSVENRQLINAVDLAEPQLRPSKAIRDAIYDIELDRLTENKTDQEAFKAVNDELQKIWTDVPVVVERLSPPHQEEPPVQDTVPEPEPEPPVLTRHVHAGGQDSHLTEQQVAEVIDAYVDGIPVQQICDVLNIATTTLYAILREHGIALRGRPGNSRWVSRTPEEFKIRLSGAQSTMPVSPTPIEKTPTNGVVSELTEWVVTYTVTRTETVTVQAKGFSAAASAVSAQEPDAEVISVAKAKAKP